jgi:glucose-1-phosphate thymidylyltransferase
MHSVTGNVPKALIRLGSRTILDLLCERLDELGVAITLVTNARFYDQFTAWRRATRRQLTVLNDGSTDPDNRLGAIGDIRFAIDAEGLAEDALLVAADNVLECSLLPMIEAFRRQRLIHVAVWRNDDLADQCRRGVVELDDDGRIVAFTEKPLRPGSRMAAAPLYILPRECLDEPARYLAGGGSPDAPGYLMEYLVQRHPMRAWRMPGAVLDVGNPESYAQAQRRYAKTIDR